MARDLLLREIPEDDGGSDICTTCGGAGEIHVAMNGWDEAPEYELAPCPTCLGRGVGRPARGFPNPALKEKRREQSRRALEAAVYAVEREAARLGLPPAENFMDQSEEERLKASE